LNRRPKDHWPLVVAAAGVATAAVYILFRSAYYFPDGLRWELAIAADGAAAVWHPHRLVYNGLALAFFALLKLFGYGGRLFGAMQVLDALLGGAGVLAAYAALRRAAASRGVALAGALALAFSFGYWAFACNGESVTLATVLVIVATWAVLWAGAAPSSAARWAACGALAGLATLGHISNFLVVFLLPAAVAVARPRRPGRAVAAAAASFAAVPAGAYALVAFGVLKLPSVGAAWSWVFGARLAPGAYTSFRLRNLALDAFALGRDFVAVRWYKDVAAGGWTPGRALVAAALAAAGLALAAAFGAAVVACVRGRGPRRPAVVALAAFLPFAAYFTFRDAGAWDRWLVQAWAIIFFVYATLGAAAPRRAVRAVLFALPALLFAGNFAAGIGPESRPANNEHLAFARYVGRLAGPGDLAIFSGVGGLGQGVYVNYFTRADTAYIVFGVADPAAFRADVDARLAAGHGVIVGDDRPVASALGLVAPGVEGRYAVTGPAARELLAPYKMTPLVVYRGPKYRPSPFWRLERR